MNNDEYMFLNMQISVLKHKHQHSNLDLQTHDSAK